MSALRPHDVAVALQLSLTPGASYRALAKALHLSVGEVHNAVQRLATAGLVRPDSRALHRRALLEFLVAGVPYAFPVKPGSETRGVPTAHAGPPLASQFPDADPLVWPAREGARRGAAIEPLYGGATSTPQSNPALYELLTLVDSVRVGRARERQQARTILQERLVESGDQP